MEYDNKRQKRWLLTINNPIFSNSNFIEEDISKTDLRIIDNYYNFPTLKEEANQALFEYRYIKKHLDNEQIIVKRPFFKDLTCVKTYFINLYNHGIIKYAVYQYEKSESGTPHIQAFVCYNESKRLKNVKQDFFTAHVIAANGSNLQNRDYCTKVATRIAPPVEIGTFSEMRSRTDIIEFFEALGKKSSNIELKGMFPALYAQYGPEKIERFRQDELKDIYGKEFRNVKVTYVYGNTCTGKTTYIYKNNSIDDICRVINYDKGTFETYTNQKILVLDEFTGKVDITFMNNLLDRFPVDLPARYGNRTACFDEVYIISNLHIYQIYTEEQRLLPEVYKAFLRRIENIIHFTDFNVFHYEKKDGQIVVDKEQLKYKELNECERKRQLIEYHKKRIRNKEINEAKNQEEAERVDKAEMAIDEPAQNKMTKKRTKPFKQKTVKHYDSLNLVDIELVKKVSNNLDEQLSSLPF